MTGAAVPGQTQYLPSQVVDVPKNFFKNYPHSKRVGNYLMGKTLGEGSFAKVKEGLHIPTGQKIAVKIIDKKKTKSDSYVRRNLRREGKLLQQARHPNILQLYELMETENYYYLITELCRGGDLMDYICQRKKIEEKEVRRFIRQIVLAVDYLHRIGILHRDLKIENLLLDANKDIKIIDFGLSNSIRSPMAKDDHHSKDYCVTQCGSPAYAAPELLGQRKYGPQVDVWSIGVNMFAMLTGNLPFTADPFNIKVLYNKMLAGQINPLPNTLSKECVDLIKQILCPDPDKRITVTEILKHPWICEGRSTPPMRSPCPNKLCSDDLNNDILKHMSENIGFRMSDVIRFVTGNVPSPATAMYHLLEQRLKKHAAEMRLKESSSSVDIKNIGTNRITLTIREENSNESNAKRRFMYPTPRDKQTPSSCLPKSKNENDVNVMDLEEDKAIQHEDSTSPNRHQETPTPPVQISHPRGQKGPTSHNRVLVPSPSRSRSGKKYVGDTALRILQGDGSVRMKKMSDLMNNDVGKNERPINHQMLKKTFRKNTVARPNPCRRSLDMNKHNGMARTAPSTVCGSSEDRTFLDRKKARFLHTALKKLNRQENISPRNSLPTNQNAVHLYRTIIGDKVLNEISDNCSPAEAEKKSTEPNSKRTLVNLRNSHIPPKYAVRLTINDLDVGVSNEKFCTPTSKKVYIDNISPEIPEHFTHTKRPSDVTLPTLSVSNKHS